MRIPLGCRTADRTDTGAPLAARHQRPTFGETVAAVTGFVVAGSLAHEEGMGAHGEASESRSGCGGGGTDDPTRRCPSAFVGTFFPHLASET
jgi:hypothetical protein